MRVLVTGATGLVGGALVAALTAAGDEVRVLGRRGDGATWDPVSRRLDPGDLHGTEAVVHLAGEPLGRRRWSAGQRGRIMSSRAVGTRLLSEALAVLDPRPTVLVSASAVGYYGDRGSEVLTEDSAPGEGFLAEVCRDWEAGTAAASDAGIRTVLLRSGVILDRGGGALARQLPLFRLGLGGRLGSGRQWLSWISLADEVAVIERCLSQGDLAGPVNATAPQPVTNVTFTSALARTLSRPAFLAVPRPALVLAFGATMTDEMIMASQRVHPTKLLDSGFRFDHPQIEDGLAAAVAG